MLQRAANNTYSWWWASHIRTKQSKWMEQNLQDMEEKVTDVLKLIEEDGDSFARRAEMYYKKRPELIQFVEESYRAYRALSERYDHLSTELQHANSTIASLFPDHLQFASEDEDEFGSPKFTRKPSDSPRRPSDSPRGYSFPTTPKIPRSPVNRDSKGFVPSSGIKRRQHKRTISRGNSDVISRSGMSKLEGMNEIHRLHKRILALQTEKEFARSTYESAMAMYWGFDGDIQEIHERLCALEDEFGEGKAIADDEARIIMEVTALKSCRETLAQLEDKQARSAEEARVEKKRIKVSRDKLDALKNKFELIQGEHIRTEHESHEDNDDIQKRKEIESLKEKIKQQFEDFFGGSLSVAEMAEKIDELVNNVINLKSLVASQTVLVHRLRTEIDMLEAQLEAVEGDDMAALIDGRNDVKNKITEMEEKLKEIEDLSQSFENQNNSLQTHFTQASCNLSHLSEKVHSMIEKLEKEKSSSIAVKSLKEIKEANKMSKMLKTGMVLEENSTSKNESEEEPSEEENSNGCNTLLSPKLDHNDGLVDVKLDHKDDAKLDHKDDGKENESVASSTQPFLKDIEDKEKDLLMQYSSMLRKYKDTEKSKKLMEVEANNQDDRMSEIMSKLKELEKSNAAKDELILSLKEKIGLFQTGLGKPIETQPAEKEEKEDIGVIIPVTTSIEDKFRADIDELLEKNLDFWFRFSTTFQEVNKFKARVKDLLAEVSDIEERRKQSRVCRSPDYSLQTDVKPLYKHLKEVQNELTVWMEKGLLLKDELKDRFSSLCEIQEEITRAVKESAEDDEFNFTSLQAAKFQGEILNMKQENMTVSKEVQAGLNNVTKLQHEMERGKARLRGGSGHLVSKSHENSPNIKTRHSDCEPGVPLSAFILTGKPKKQKTSFFHRMNTGFLRSVQSCKY